MAFTRRSRAIGALLFSALIAAVIADRAAIAPPADAPAAQRRLNGSIPGMPWSIII